ncbi:hypothetical protein L3V82_04490 [Thiotrichales bacterium 19S3-7]|nr:hypothetical protein [Thiotrichales bacterium 19S3-7]MCF6801353.1 hypothetical protein [Thiotrichales bacterium 19S3-11]
MSYEINSQAGVIEAIQKGIPLVITHSNTQDPLNVHGQIYVPKVGNDGCGIVYEGLFWANQFRIARGMTVIDTSKHKDIYDDEVYGRRDFILRKQHVSTDLYKEHYHDKYCHQAESHKYKVIAYPELTAEMIDHAATTEKFNGEGYPKYNCHTFIDHVIGHAYHNNYINVSNRNSFFRIYNALYNGATTIFKKQNITSTSSIDAINQHIVNCPTSRAAKALALLNKYKGSSNGISKNNNNLFREIHQYAYESSKLFSKTNTQNNVGFIFATYARQHPESRSAKIAVALDS